MNLTSFFLVHMNSIANAERFSLCVFINSTIELCKFDVFPVYTSHDPISVCLLPFKIMLPF